MRKSKEQIIKDQESIGNIQITEKEWIEMSDEGGVYINCSDEYLYFKPKPEYKRVFENEIINLLKEKEN